MALIENEIQCEEVIYKKGDDFFVVMEVLNEETDDPFDVDLIEMVWEISDSEGVLVTISDSDLTIEDNYIQFHKAASFFDDFIFMGEYTHRLYEVTTNTTSMEGKFTLQ